jgi:hypothetical protein
MSLLDFVHHENLHVVMQPVVVSCLHAAPAPACRCCSACPSPLLDAGSQAFSWALQACQLWELLQDAQLLCRHLNLQQVCSMVSTATTPPPAVLRHRQQVGLV